MSEVVALETLIEDGEADVAVADGEESLPGAMVILEMKLELAVGSERLVSLTKCFASKSSLSDGKATCRLQDWVSQPEHLSCCRIRPPHRTHCLHHNLHHWPRLEVRGPLRRHRRWSDWMQHGNGRLREKDRGTDVGLRVPSSEIRHLGDWQLRQQPQTDRSSSCSSCTWFPACTSLWLCLALWPLISSCAEVSLRVGFCPTESC